MDKSKFESVIVPGGCTKYIQAPDFVWNKAFRGKAEEVYGSWLANVKKEFTGNRKPIPSRLAAKCVSKARNELLKEVISSSLRRSGYALMVLKTTWFPALKKAKSVNEVYHFAKTKLPLQDGEINRTTFEIHKDNVLDALVLSMLWKAMMLIAMS